MRDVLSGLLRDFEAAHIRPCTASAVEGEDQASAGDCLAALDGMSDLDGADLDALLESEVGPQLPPKAPAIALRSPPHTIWIPSRSRPSPCRPAVSIAQLTQRIASCLVTSAHARATAAVMSIQSACESAGLLTLRTSCCSAVACDSRAASHHSCANLSLMTVCTSQGSAPLQSIQVLSADRTDTSRSLCGDG